MRCLRSGPIRWDTLAPVARAGQPDVADEPAGVNPRIYGSNPTRRTISANRPSWRNGSNTGSTLRLTRHGS
jgi:hypothetical protein